MQPLIINEQDDTPKVILDQENNIFEISGKSLPEDVLSFYQPIYDWLEKYIKNPNNDTQFTMNIDYFNSASHKAINDLLDILAHIKKNGKPVKVIWHYLRDDDDMLETGKDYADVTGLDFEFISYE